MSQRKRVKKTIIFQPNGYRYLEYPVSHETPRSAILETPKDEPTIRMWKHPYAPAWTGEKETLFLSLEGTPSLALPDDEGNLRWVDLIEFLTEIWTEKLMNRLPGELKAPLLAHWVTQVTVRPAPIDDEAKKAMDKLYANELLYDSNLNMAEQAGKATEEKSIQQRLFELIPLAGFFFMLGYFAVKQGII